MKLQTTIPIQAQTRNQIDYSSKILLIGSCFSENIGNKFNYFKFQAVQNPFGILFHPKAIEKLITNAINEKEYQTKDIFLHQERWHNFEAHSSLSATAQTKILDRLNASISKTNKSLTEASHVIITLGTSWVYRHIASDNIVANCHKIPQKKFLKELLSVDEITESLEAIIQLIKSVNNKVVILFTISPVRHVKDGFVENTQSKAHLIAAVHQLVDSRKNISYFPSYEIMMDELRDYRFYKEDMVHPNSTAISYIWERFVNTWFSKNCTTTMKEIENIQKGIAHKSFNEASEQHQKFLANLNAKKTKLKEQFPFLDF